MVHGSGLGFVSYGHLNCSLLRSCLAPVRFIHPSLSVVVCHTCICALICVFSSSQKFWANF